MPYALVKIAAYLLIKHNAEYQGDFFYSLCMICQIFFISLQL